MYINSMKYIRIDNIYSKCIRYLKHACMCFNALYMRKWPDQDDNEFTILQ